MKFKFRKIYELRNAKGEINNGEILVEKAGYVPAKRQIEAMLFAGRMLDSARAEEFDGTVNDNLDDFEDPTRTPGFDMADVTDHVNYLDSLKKEMEEKNESLRTVEKQLEEDKIDQKEEGEKE